MLAGDAGAPRGARDLFGCLRPVQTSKNAITERGHGRGSRCPLRPAAAQIDVRCDVGFRGASGNVSNATNPTLVTRSRGAASAEHFHAGYIIAGADHLRPSPAKNRT